MRNRIWMGTVLVFLIACVPTAPGEKIPSPNYSTILYLAGSGPDAEGTMSDIRILQHFTIIAQPDGKGDYVGNDFKDEDCYKLDMKAKGGLEVIVFGKPVRADAQWRLGSRFGAFDTSILSGMVSGFVYGGPAGVSTARLQTECRVYNTDGAYDTWNPGVYQGFASKREPNGRLLSEAYQLVWYHRLNAGLLVPVSSGKQGQ